MNPDQYLILRELGVSDDTGLMRYEAVVQLAAGYPKAAIQEAEPGPGNFIVVRMDSFGFDRFVVRERTEYDVEKVGAAEEAVS